MLPDPTRHRRPEGRLLLQTHRTVPTRGLAGPIQCQTPKANLEAIQVLGGNGYINDYPTGRLLRDAKLYEIGAGTSEIRRMLIGRELFEESA